MMEKRSGGPRRSHPLLLVLSSATLLVLSFPHFNLFGCAWVALVPWLLLLRGCSPRIAFGWSYLIGAAFFLGSMWWLVHVTVIGWAILSAYLALYFGVFGYLTCTFGAGSPEKWGRFYFFRLLLLPSVWVGLEYLRSHLLTGLGWNLLAYSQVSWLDVIQVADVTGAWGVSFLIVMVNVGLTESIAIRLGVIEGVIEQKAARMVGVALISLVMALLYGMWRIAGVNGSETIRVAVVQGNIPQNEKWDEARRETILERYEALTREAAAAHPQLIVWPETSTPGFFGLDEALTQRVIAIEGAAGIPLLIGAPTGHLDGAAWRVTNSAFLLEPTGEWRQRYDKVHLVPFGEFIPFERAIPWLRNVLPPTGDFVPGEDYTVFQLGSGLRAQGSGQQRGPQPPAQSPELRFSVLICFEDIFPDLARQFVQRGAQLLVVITNDAWFGPTAAAYQHAQASTFRAVELRVPVARAANTGWSGCIDPAGRGMGAVRGAGGAALFVAGTHTCDLPMPLASARTLYLRWGDWFAWLCLLICALALGNSRQNLFPIKQLR